MIKWIFTTHGILFLQHIHWLCYMLHVAPNFHINSHCILIFILENFYQKGGVFLKNSGVQEIALIDSFVNKNYTVCTCCAHFQVCTFYNTHSNSDYFKVEQRAFCKCRVFFVWTLKWMNLYIKFWWNNLWLSGGSYKIIMVMWELAYNFQSRDDDHW